MSTKNILMFAAAAAVVYVWGYQRGLTAGSTQASAGPIVGSGTDWLNWQTP